MRFSTFHPTFRPSSRLLRTVRAFLCGLAAGVGAAAYAAPSAEPAPSYRCDVVVIGSGGAGMSAAITAREAGARVLILEKMPTVGGNTLWATGHVSATGSVLQKERGLTADAEAFVRDMLKEGGGKADPKLVEHMVKGSGEAIDWLIGLGADLTEVRKVPGSTESRLFRPKSSETVGSEIVTALFRRTEELQIPVMTFTRAEDLILREGRVTGVRAETGTGHRFNVSARSVVLATGGYAGGEELLERHSPESAREMTSNSPGTTGDGLVMGKRAGAGTTCLSAILYHPTAVPLSGAILPEALRADGAILLNAEGKRFVNELASSNAVSAAVRAGDHYAWLLVDAPLARRAPVVSHLVSEGLVYPIHSEAQLAAVLHVEPQTIVDTLDRYREFARRSCDEDFGRPTLLSDFSEFPLYAVRVRPAVHGTVGGLTINGRAQVLDRAGNPIPGLYAAGEVTGGVHGSSRLEDTALTDALVFGRTAGREAAAHAVEVTAKTAEPRR